MKQGQNLLGFHRNHNSMRNSKSLSPSNTGKSENDLYLFEVFKLQVSPPTLAMAFPEITLNNLHKGKWNATESHPEKIILGFYLQAKKML